jgi:NAD(P) transhydrogenase subunit alpha
LKIAIPKERRLHERRVAATPDIVKKYRELGFDVMVEAGAGAACRIGDEQYAAAGATVVADPQMLLAQADIVLKVQRPLLSGEQDIDELAYLKPGSLLLGILSPYSSPSSLEAYALAGITAVALELVPRITRAQGMDVLSSQSNLAGYRAVLDAVYHFDRVLPMMMTAAGTLAPARVMVFGAGVAGLQAIATAKRLGAIVSATDVRMAAKEQVESLGGKFVMVDSDEMRSSETAGGYAKEMSEDFKRKQAELVAATLAKQDIAICTALIPGRKAPMLITEAMVQSMKPGSVIVDLAVEQGGNCALSQPGEVVEVNGVTIVGHLNMPARVASDASALYARNLFNYLAPHARKADTGVMLALDHADEIVKASVICHGGHIVHPAFAPQSSKESG